MAESNLLKKNFFKKNLTFGISVNMENIKMNENIFPNASI